MGIDNTGVVADMPESTGRRNMYVTHLDAGEYIRLRGVDFGDKGARKFSLTASAEGNCTASLHVDAPNGPIIGSVKVTDTKALDRYKDFSAKVNGIKGVHDLYIVIDKVDGDVRLDYWMFK